MEYVFDKMSEIVQPLKDLVDSLKQRIKQLEDASKAVVDLYYKGGDPMVARSMEGLMGDLRDALKQQGEP